MASPSKIKEYILREDAIWDANSAAWASLMDASVVERHLVAAWIILPLESLRIIAASEKSFLTATSKLVLKLPGRGGAQVEERA